MSGPIISWQIEGENMEPVTDLIVSNSKITVNVDYKYEINRPLLLGGKTMTNLVLKRRDMSLLTKTPSATNAYGLPNNHV